MASRSLRDQAGLQAFRLQSHPECFVCGTGNKHGLNLVFGLAEEGRVEAVFCDPLFAGYQGMLHGGVISSLLDGAMTHCLFAHGSRRSRWT